MTAAAPLCPEDRAEIHELYARYAFYIDQREDRAWADLFTPDGQLDYPSLSGDGTRDVIKGRDALAKAVRDWNEQKGKTRIHTPLLPIVRPRSADRVKVLVAVMVADIDPATLVPDFNGYGMSYDDVVRVDGRWLFERRASDLYNAVPLEPDFLT